MSKPIVQTVKFPVSAKALYGLYMNPRKHAAFTGGKVVISPKPGSKFSAFDGLLSGTTLQTIPGKLIIQHWRATHWKKTDPDTILIIAFKQAGQQGQIDLVHLNVPEHDHAGVTKGWKKFYWTPLKALLKTGRSNKSKM